jgi:hypothetical protein
MRTQERKLALAAALALASACYVDVPAEVTKGVVVTTRRDPSAAFGGYQTFLVNPSIPVYQDGAPVAGAAVPDDLRTAIVGAVSGALAGRGYDPCCSAWTPGATPAPDLGVQITFVLGEVDTYVPSDWCDPYWGDCWYWPWGYTVSYKTGTLVIDLLDVSAGPSPGGAYQTRWAALAHGVAADFPSYDVARFLEAIDRAFAQSPYLGTAN